MHNTHTHTHVYNIYIYNFIFRNYSYILRSICTIFREAYSYTLLMLHICFGSFSVAPRPNAGHGLLILEVSRSHTTTHHIR